MTKLTSSPRLIITGAAGLVGQNLVTCLIESGCTDIVAIDKDKHNLDILQALHPQVQCVCADLSCEGEWTNSFSGAQCFFLLQAQITGDTYAPFEQNTVKSTTHVLKAAKKHSVPFVIHVSSAVVNSVTDDNYTRSKKEQEHIVRDFGLPHCVVRPTLMFGWFDSKHLGWLSRFMERCPVYPIPGSGRYLRQPLYVRDFCRVLVWCMIHRPEGQGFNIVGSENIDYIDIVRIIKRVKGLHTLILPIPVWLFRFLLKMYGVIFPNPPFVPDQMDALMAGDVFQGDNMEVLFSIQPTPFSDAIRDTFCNDRYSKVVLERSNRS